ncbi:helix-turn-helix domain-containing protein [Mesorhizobium sp.]|uniref:helix-turn-helix domain-containing protein n=1 Tax=Mesorhizobium sp. TaxID=1871066 RepID=UPI00258E699A|nr:helix-turn-helix domain-containing protein [Mesorhizobium sp.]
MVAALRSIDHLPLEHRDKAWLDWFEELSLSASVDDQPIPRGTMHLRAANATTRLADVSGTPQRIVPMRRDHGILFALIVAGRGRLVAPHQAFDLADGDMMVLGTADDWSMTFRSDFRAFILQAAAGPLEARLGRSGIRLPKVLGSTVVAAVAKSGLRTLGSNLETSGAADLTAAEVALTELVASALLGEVREPAGSLTGVQAAHFRRVAATIDTRLSDPDLALALIARLEGLSVRYAQKLFERRGESFSEYVRQQRLEHCRIDLADPNHAHESVAAIGQRWGFRDQSHFSRTFGATFGMSPRQVRRARSQTEELIRCAANRTAASRRRRGRPRCCRPLWIAHQRQERANAGTIGICQQQRRPCIGAFSAARCRRCCASIRAIQSPLRHSLSTRATTGSGWWRVTAGLKACSIGHPNTSASTVAGPVRQTLPSLGAALARGSAFTS